MATATVGSGKDYSTLTTWAAAVSGSAGAQDAECYSGGDLGQLTITSWTPSSSDIYAATGHQHDGTDAGTSGVCYTGFALSISPTAGSKTFSVRGIRFNAGVTATFNAASVSGVTYNLKRCLFSHTSGAVTTLITFSPSGTSGTLTANVHNNVVYQSGSASGSNAVYCNAVSAAGTCIATFNFYNNTLIESSAGAVTIGIQLRANAGAGSAATVNAVVKNNAIFGYSSTCYVSSTTGAGTPTVSTSGSGYNAATDATADDFGATGALNSQTAANWVTAVATNATLLSTSPGREAGNNTGAPSDDVIGTARPQQTTVDIGAFEYPVSLIMNRLSHCRLPCGRQMKHLKHIMQ